MTRPVGQHEIGQDSDGFPVAAIQPRRHPRLLTRLNELYQYRELIRNLVASELKARYKNSTLGFLWSMLNPLAMMLVFTIVFGVIMPNPQIDKYPLFLLCGLLPWNFFAEGVMSSLNSVVNNANLIKKVYFPREVLPIAGVLAQLVNFLLAFVILFVALLIFRASFSPWLWMLPILIVVQTCFTIGIALILSTLNVFYRDTVLIMNVVMLAWFFLTPIFYAAATLPASYTVYGIELNVRRLLFIFNPMASLVNLYQDLLYWGSRTDFDFFWRTVVTALAVLVLGYWIFVRYSDRFGEEL